MNYHKIYQNIIQSRKLLNRSKNDGNYYESHHIIPKSLGGLNNKENLILLTFKEHFLVHLLLVEMYEGQAKSKMAYALMKMCGGNKEQKRIISAYQYEKAKKLLTGSKHSDDTKNKISNSLKGRHLSNETKSKISKSNKGKHKISNEMRIKLAQGKKGKPSWNKNKKLTEEHKRKVSESRKGIAAWNKGKKLSKEYKQKLSEAHKGKPSTFKGKRHTEETKNKIRESLKKYKNENIGN